MALLHDLAVHSHNYARRRAIHPLLSRMRSVFEAVRCTFCLWNQRRNDRAILRSLSQRDIQDFCPKYTEAQAEMYKPFWRA